MFRAETLSESRTDKAVVPKKSGIDLFCRRQGEKMNGLHDGLHLIGTVNIILFQNIFYKFGAVEAPLLPVADPQTGQP